MRKNSITRIAKASGFALVLAGYTLAAAKTGKAAKALPGLPLKDLVQQAQYIVEARPLPAFSSRTPITFSEAGVEIAPLDRKTYRFKTGAALKNVLGSDLPDTLTVFEAGTADAVRAHRAAALKEDAPPVSSSFYSSPIKEKLLGKEKSVILFLYEVRDDSTISPSGRFELAAENAYEKGSNRKAVAANLPKAAEPETEP